MRKYVIYQITNKANGKIYIGAHKTDNMNDSYFGSGIHISRAIKKYGLDQFVKEILFQYDNEIEMYEKEREIVNEIFINRKDTYNIALGGIGGDGRIGRYRDKEGNEFSTYRDDPRILSGEIESVAKGTVVVKDKNGNFLKVSSKDERFLNGELISMFKGTVLAKNKEGKVLRVKKDDIRLSTGELVNNLCGSLNAIDKDGNITRVGKDDNRLSTGELKGFYRGTKFTGKYTHSEEIKKQLSNMKKGTKLSSEHIMALKMSRKGKNNSIEHNNNISKALTGLVKSKEHCKNISKAKIGIKPNLSNEVRKKKKDLCSGSNNFFSKYCCIVKDQDKKWVKKEEVESYIDLGWSKYSSRWKTS